MSKLYIWQQTLIQRFGPVVVVVLVLSFKKCSKAFCYCIGTLRDHEHMGLYFQKH